MTLKPFGTFAVSAEYDLEERVNIVVNRNAHIKIRCHFISLLLRQSSDFESITPALVKIKQQTLP
jgi:hypothetical protein